MVYSTLTPVSRSREVLTTVEQPLSEAAYGTEINTVGTGLGVMKYLETEATWIGCATTVRTSSASTLSTSASPARPPSAGWRIAWRCTSSASRPSGTV